MTTSLVPVATKLATKPDLSPATVIGSIQPTRVMSNVGQDMRTIWYFEGAADGRKKTCAYIMHPRGSKTFTLAYHPLDRNDQVVQDLPMDKLGDAINDLLAAGFGKRPTPPSRSCPESALVRTLNPAAKAIAGSSPAERTTLQLGG